MSMYALQVMTGMEAEITRKLRGKGVDARCLQERRMIRRGGKWQEQLYTLFPSYIFVSTPDVYRVYYAVCHEDGVLHWLGATKGTPEALSAHEEANILWLAGDGPLPPSDTQAEEFWGHVDQFHRDIRASHPWYRRLRAILSINSWRS